MSLVTRFINKFTGGMKRGIDAAQQKNDTYDYALNGRVIYNDDGTYAFENTKGTRIVFTLAADYGNGTGYEIIGSDYLNGTLIIFSTNSDPITGIGNNEIGLVRQNQFDTYTYQTAFNDKYDPNGDNLRFSRQFNIIADSVQENNVIERVYWNDDRNEPRAFNFVSGAAFNYATPYPSWYSVHGINALPDLTWGLIKYQQNIAGSLKSGQRQYAYRYIHQTGYASPWSYLTDFIMMSSKNVSPTNWMDYDMGASGLVTTKGHQLEIKYLDTRFQKVQVAALYWETDTAATEATIIFEGDITGTSITVTHTSDSGQKIAIDELVQKFFNIKKAKTQAIQRDNFYQLGNIELFEDLQLSDVEVAGITAEPVIKRMISDTTEKVDTTPLTNQTPTLNDKVTKRLFAGSSAIDEKYDIVNDYINYKGTQWAHLFKGRFRQDTTPYAIVIWNRKGQPLFAQHITDYTMPKQYDNIFTDARISGTTTGTVGAVGDYVLTNYDPGSVVQITDNQQQANNIVLQTLGMKFGNINLTNILFDANGDLQVSGFSIVAMDRLGIVLAQGILCNTTRAKTQNSCGDTYTDETRPLPSSWNFLTINNNNQVNTLGANWINNECCQKPIRARGFWHTLEAPDYFINPLLFESSSVSDNIELVGGCHPSFKPAGFENVSTELLGGHGHFYNKNYQTPNSGWISILDGVIPTADAHFGNTYQVGKLFSNAKDINNIQGSLFWRRYSSIVDYLSLSAFTYSGGCIPPKKVPFSAIAHEQTLLILIEGLSTCSLNLGAHDCCHYIVNYLKSVATQQMTQSLLGNRVYHNIGHFVPINATTLAAADNGAGQYIFNDVEVWGGDCYADYFGLSRLTPGYFGVGSGDGYDHPGDCDYDPGYYGGVKPDYAIGIIFPYEGQYNHTMRSGNSYPKVATEPMATYCGDSTEFSDGIYFATEDDKRSEDFAVNKVLQAEDLISLYNSKKELLNPDVTDFPLMEIYAGAKFYGEQFDAYRRFLINNFQFANGRYGEIQAIRELDGILYVWQRSAFGHIRFNERELVNTESGTISTGTGAGYGGHDYINTEYGTQHQFSIVPTGKAFYWVDSEKGKLLRFAQNGVDYISDMYDARWFREKLREYWYVVDDTPNTFEADFYDNPSYLGGIHGVYDYKNNAAIFTFTDRKEHRKSNVTPSNPSGITTVGEPLTIEYSEVNDAFATYHSFTPKWYMRNKQNYYSMNPAGGTDVFAHEEGNRNNVYGSIVPSKLGFYVNDKAAFSKVFDNIHLEVVGDTEIIKQVTGVTNIVNLQTIILNDVNVDDRPTYREGLIVSPIMELNQGVRLRGQWMRLEYEIENPNNKSVRITSNQTLYRLSERT